MLNGILPNNPGTCKTPVDQHKEIADSVRFNATPTILYDNGLVTRQKVTAEEIMQLLNSKKQNKTYVDKKKQHLAVFFV